MLPTMHEIGFTITGISFPIEHIETSNIIIANGFPVK